MQLPSRRTRLLLLALLALFVVAGILTLMYPRRVAYVGEYIYSKLNRQRATVRQRMEQYADGARSRLRPHFDSAGVDYPPTRITLLGLKAEKILRVYAANPDEELKPIRDYPILAASGVTGPKLREGDRQVPEGIYRVSYLNPNSMFHLSLGIDYPNKFDKARAQEENRRELGGEIMIHGDSVSIGCLAMGDEAAEDLFVLTADIGIQNVKVVLAPCDLRYSPAPADTPKLDWLPDLYEIIRAELTKLPE